MRVLPPAAILLTMSVVAGWGVSCSDRRGGDGDDGSSEPEIDCTPYTGLCDEGAAYPYAYVCNSGRPKGECQEAPDPIDSHVKTSWCCAADCAPVVLTEDPCDPGRTSYFCHSSGGEQTLKSMDCEFVGSTEIPCCF